jgi:hypothetical protein
MNFIKRLLGKKKKTAIKLGHFDNMPLKTMDEVGKKLIKELDALKMENIESIIKKHESCDLCKGELLLVAPRIKIRHKHLFECHSCGRRIYKLLYTDKIGEIDDK